MNDQPNTTGPTGDFPQTDYAKGFLQKITRMTRRKIAEATALITGRASGDARARLIATLDMLERYEQEKRLHPVDRWMPVKDETATPPAPDDTLVLEINPLTSKSVYFCLGEGELTIYAGRSVDPINLVGDRMNCLLVLQAAVARIADRIKSELSEATTPTPHRPNPEY